MMDMLKTIAKLILPKDDVDKLPPHVIHMSKDLARAINDDETLDESERSESAYYLLTENIICKQCGYGMCIPIGEIPAELYGGCSGDEICSHDFETVIDKDKQRLKDCCFGILPELHLEELIKTENPAEGVLYFNDSWWKIKSGKSVYAAHLHKKSSTVD